MLHSLWSSFLDCLYPPKCPACRAGVGRHGEWCLPCAQSLLAVRRISGVQHHLRYLDSCFILCEYRGTVKRMLQDIKFRSNLKFVHHLTWLLTCYAGPARFSPVDVVIPVPLHDDRRKERGYNQSEEIYRNWVLNNGWSWSADALARDKHTEPLWGLPLYERRSTVKGVFKVTGASVVSGAAVLLADDIFTSGTTMEECARTLKKAGALRVTGIAIAGGQVGR